MIKINNNWQDNEDYIIQEYLSGRKQIDIANEFDKATNTTIRRILKRNNVDTRPYNSTWEKVKSNKFIDLKDPNVQYWLGYMCADGCIYDNVKVDIASGLDKDHMQAYADWIGYGVKVNSSKDKRYEDKYTHRVCFSHKETFDYLVGLGITPRKSLTMKLNFDITWDFVRGLFDGDGCVSTINKKYTTNRCRVVLATASIDFANQLMEFAKSEGLTPRLNTDTCAARKEPMHTVIFAKHKEVAIIYNKFYSDASYYLERKYKKFGAFSFERGNENTAKSGKAASANPELAND